MAGPVFILGGAQSDFAVHLSRSGGDLSSLTRETITACCADAQLELADIETLHVGNAFGELFTGQSHMGALPATALRALWGVPASRHEGACASGSLAVLAAASEIEAGRYGVSLVLGIEQERNVDGETGARHMASAAHAGHEGDEARYLWPHMFARIAAHYDERFGLCRAHLAALSRKNLSNARTNPRAQTRGWSLTQESFADEDKTNPVVERAGGFDLRRQDCAQVTDGAAALILASGEAASVWARKRGRTLEDLPRLAGWGHRTVGLPLEEKLARSREAGRHDPQSPVFPHVRAAFSDALRRARVESVHGLDGAEVHDCFSITEYMAIEHMGLTAFGEARLAIEQGMVEKGGQLPVNPSGGLIGGGHPVGATGVRMLLDASRQVMRRAGDTQVASDKGRFATLNIGGSTSTVVSFVVARGAA